MEVIEEIKVESCPLLIKLEPASPEHKNQYLEESLSEEQLAPIKSEEICLESTNEDQACREEGGLSHIEYDVFIKDEIVIEPMVIQASTQIKQEKDDIIIEINNDQSTSNSRRIKPVRADKKAAERSRLYRERHREEINRRRRENRQIKKNSLNQNISQSTPATGAERTRKYRERNRQKTKAGETEIGPTVIQSRSKIKVELCPLLIKLEPVSPEHENQILEESVPEERLAPGKSEVRCMEIEGAVLVCQDKGGLSHIEYEVFVKDEIEIEPTVIQARVDNKAAERSRLYREQHREKINQRRRENRQRKTNRPKQYISQWTPATAAERNRIYRERNKQRINERRRESRRQQKIDQVESTVEVAAGMSEAEFVGNYSQSVQENVLSFIECDKVVYSDDYNTEEQDLCNYEASQKSDLTPHIHIHAGDKPFFCNLCNFKTNRKYNLTNHIRTHTGYRPFSCNLCNYKSNQKSHLKQHIRTHTGDKPFSCNLCDFKTNYKRSLTIHIRTHTGDKPFCCNLCDYKASQRSDIIRHIRSHTGDKPFSCNLCDFKSNQRSRLTVHIRTHTGDKPFSCNLCNFKTHNKFSLTVHIRTHTEDKPFACNLCNFKSNHRASLTVHIRSHTRGKPFSCNLCNYKARQESRLINHIRTHT